MFCYLYIKLIISFITLCTLSAVLFAVILKAIILISHGLLWRALNYNFKKREIEIASPEPFRQKTIIGEILDNQSS